MTTKPTAEEFFQIISELMPTNKHRVLDYVRDAEREARAEGQARGEAVAGGRALELEREVEWLRKEREESVDRCFQHQERAHAEGRRDGLEQTRKAVRKLAGCVSTYDDQGWHGGWLDALDAVIAALEAVEDAMEDE